MKLSILSTALLINTASAFTPSIARPIYTSTTSMTSLNLFGGKKEGSGDNKGGGPMGGMMDQLAMFKKAQEIAQKKKSLDEEIAKMDIIGKSADGNIKVTVKYVPAQLPATPSPGYDAVGIDIDEGYLNEVSAEQLSEDLVIAIRDGETVATQTVAEKYKVLDEELGSILGGMTGKAAE